MIDHLDLKYRPRRFSDVVGNAGSIRLLRKLSSEGRLARRSLMFGGPKGCGKTSLARIVARAIVCDELKDGEPCGACTSCLSVLAESSDSYEEFDAATQGTVDRMRSIVDSLDYGNLSGKPFVFILDEAHRLSKQAQDALLKSVEDRRLVVIMCTTEPQKMQGAIRSRVTEFPIYAPSEPEIVSRMVDVCQIEGIQFDPEGIALAARSLDCCPRSCLHILELLSPSVTLDAVKDHFRHRSIEALVRVLATVDSSPGPALESLDLLMASEGPAWVRDSVISAVSSAMRVSVGARPNFPSSNNFFQVRGRRWADLARILASFDRPSAADIETALIAGGPIQISDAVIPPAAFPPRVEVPMIPSVPPVVPNVQLTTVPVHAPRAEVPAQPVQPPPRAESPAPTVEVDGIKFTRHESLTSLDDKIGGQTAPPALVAPDSVVANVELDRSKIPIPEKEFARGFVERFQKRDRP